MFNFLLFHLSESVSGPAVLTTPPTGVLLLNFVHVTLSGQSKQHTLESSPHGYLSTLKLRKHLDFSYLELRK